MPNDDIEQRLIRWADWLIKINSGSLGFPRECSYTRMQQRGDSGFCSPEVDLESGETEDAVRSLPDHLKLAVRVFYLFNATPERKAKYLRCGESSMYRRLQRAHRLIRECLEENKSARIRKKIKTSS